MDIQIFLGSDKPTPDKMDPIENGAHLNKPEGGLWTSTVKDGKSAWIQWCERENWWNVEGEKIMWALIPEDDVNLYEIDSFDDLEQATEEYGYSLVNSASRLQKLDFEAMTEEYDGIHLTDRGQRETRHSNPALYGWDAEGTVWFDWCFDEVHRLGKLY